MMLERGGREKRERREGEGERGEKEGERRGGSERWGRVDSESGTPFLWWV